MSVVQTRHCRDRWRWFSGMIPWYRQLLALVFGLGVLLIALWGIDQGNGAILIISVAGMGFMSLLLIFGIEVDSIEIGDKVKIEFSSTTVDKHRVERADDTGDDD